MGGKRFGKMRVGEQSPLGKWVVSPNNPCVIRCRTTGGKKPKVGDLAQCLEYETPVLAQRAAQALNAAEDIANPKGAANGK